MNKLNIIEWGLCAGLLVLSWLDLKYKEIPCLPTVLCGGLVFGLRMWQGVPLQELGVGMLPGALLLVLSNITKGGVGAGDGIVLLVLGIGIGAAEAACVFGTALLLCAAVAMVAVVVRWKGLKEELPFLPFLLMGYLGSMFYAV